ncbi:hypothetical protein H0194_04920 [Corynebacterium incognita]|uniref:Esterase n=1 Tax=Corynebacterium incognita TaxID=2754725 RepID=A0A7G7CRV4_9CORY|nr:alpha/beta hydrolase-fold protein [Corynebacterium incognita]QNE90320.1 hypothetical protein H0194_04920 [Corynebacterium incognita]
MRKKVTLTRQSSPRSPRAPRTALALPAALAVGLALAPVATPVASAQSSALSGLSSNSGLSDSFAPSDPPKRTPIDTQRPVVDGLPKGVSVDRVEYLSPRHLMVYIKSAAMPGKLQKVQVLLARDWYSQPEKKFPEVWALDGLRARDDESGWTIETNIIEQYADKNVNVVMPVGGESSFYSDWQKPDNGKHYKWETFLTKELVPIMQNAYRSNGKRAVVGISMGGTAAMNLAERNPHLFEFVGSFSGYLDTTSQGMPEAIAAAQLDAGGYTATNMWGRYGSQDWIDHDPKLGAGALKDMDVYVSAGSGKDDYGQKDSVAKGPANMAGVGLEVLSRMSTDTFIGHAKKAGIDPIVKFRPSGVHSWEYWQFEMTQAWPYMAKALGLSKEDTGADCQAVGAIGAVTKSGVIGSCLNNAYEVGDGKRQDFRSGTAYWSQETGAKALYGAINARYNEIGGPTSWLGFPKTGEGKTPDGKGRFVHFEHGSIYWTAKTGAWAIPADMRDVWGKNGWETGDLKYPAGPVQKVGKGLVQEFQNGFLVRAEDKKVHIVHGAIAAKYKEMGNATSPLGFPRGGEKKIKGGAFQEFTRGYIYWSPKTGAHVVYKGGIFDAWGKTGWERGDFGFPTSDMTTIPSGGMVAKFQGGTISEVNGKIVAKKN